MTPTSLKRRLSVWGSALIVTCTLPGCMSARAPDASTEVDTAYRPRTQTEASAAPREAAKPAARSVDFADDTVEGELLPPDSLSKGKEESRVARAPAPAPVSAASGAVMAEPMVAPMTPPPPPSTSVARREPPGKAKPQQPYADKKVMKDLDGQDEADRMSAERGNTFEAWKPNLFVETVKDPLSTFAADVDTASYTVARRYLVQGNLPPASAVRVEEFVNYFKYRYAPPETGAFTVHLEGAPSPFDSKRHFVRVGVQGKVISRSQRKPAHLVFLVDTSGSMNSQDKLPLAKEAIKIAVKNLNENDTVAIVTYAGSTKDVLPPTPATDVKKIQDALDSLQSGGGTAMGSGMELAYKHAVKKASGSVVSRVVVLTDGDANIGPNLTPQSMLENIQKYVAEGVTLTTVGFGMGNYRDDMMEKLADKGNGNSFYVDSYKEAKKVFETQLTGTLEVIAKDVKLQVEFNPVAVRRYRLLGYENRDVADNDFRNDKVDAGEIGAGHNVTAVYEVELTGDTKEALATVRVRAKAPNGTEASEQAFPFQRSMMRQSLEAASPDFRFAVAVASTADILRGNPAAEGWSLTTAQKLAEGATAGDADRNEFVRLVTQARALMGASARGN
ncbi:von Willebrand factor type A domain-containing protein [Pyxidicoccus parkwayensis]|uniref:von Willebrand factor type A domain-containing protein n=1 Tax=Pyxidicoccus parkwayensis TaxID=2813578 RepID=A0ABX7P7G4_9BACT|nr:von Willebrand factor type A domain-containing protein [Pyxidicoccus parkwaysis]QSQ26407.1 von Willebrand factor type A domain-containing protein [Pyxidicoccus parkwaysis]